MSFLFLVVLLICLYQSCNHTCIVEDNLSIQVSKSCNMWVYYMFQWVLQVNLVVVLFYYDGTDSMSVTVSETGECCYIAVTIFFLDWVTGIYLSHGVNTIKSLSNT